MIKTYISIHVDQNINGDTLCMLGQYGTTDQMKECGLVTVHDQLKIKKLISSHDHHLNSTSNMALLAASTSAATNCKGKRTLAEIKKMCTDDKQLYYTMYVFLMNAYILHTYVIEYHAIHQVAYIKCNCFYCLHA